MHEFLSAVAQTLRNCGFDDAIATYHSVVVRDIRFGVREYRRSFQFCGRVYRSGNVKQAVIDLIRQLPELLVRRDELLLQYEKDRRLRELNEQFKDRGLCIQKTYKGYTLTYTADLERLETVAKQIAAAEDIVLAPLDAALAKLSVTFTSEGGFSLN